MKKYEFYKIDNDNVGLKYKDKDFSFKVNIQLQKEFSQLYYALLGWRDSHLKDLLKEESIWILKGGILNEIG